ncbi:MAG: hypothetical protein MUO73_03185 [Thermoplasmata archaeon]|nr:hypothetical protein [Thermoplasmata archaeon]
MNKKILIISISAAVLLVVASFSSVIGTNDAQSTKKIDSPLFMVRTQRSLSKDDQARVQSHYLGKGLTSNLFITTKPSLSTAIDKTIKLLNQNPVFFAKFLEIITSNPRVIALLHENGISMAQFKTHLNRMKNDPSLFIEEIRNAEPKLSAKDIKTPLPLGLNTSNPIGCVITVIVMLPIVLIIGLIVVLFTLRILQCLNLNEIMNQLMDQIVQELFPSGYNI